MHGKPAARIRALPAGADQAADHQSEGGTGNAQGDRALDAVFALENLAPGTCRAMAAVRVTSLRSARTADPQHLGQAHADQILQADEDGDHGQEQQQRTAAFAQFEWVSRWTRKTPA